MLLFIWKITQHSLSYENIFLLAQPGFVPNVRRSDFFEDNQPLLLIKQTRTEMRSL